MRNVIYAFNYLRNKFMKVFPMMFFLFLMSIADMFILCRQLLDR